MASVLQATELTLKDVELSFSSHPADTSDFFQENQVPSPQLLVSYVL